MPTNFPGAHDDFTNPTSADDLDTPAVLHSDQHANVNDAVEAIETYLGDGVAALGTAAFVSAASLSRPFTDSTAIIKGSADPTKLFAIEVDGFTTGTTRTFTPPDANLTITVAAGTVLDDATVAAMVDTLGGASSTGSGGLVRITSPTLATPIFTTSITGPSWKPASDSTTAIQIANAAGTGIVKVDTTNLRLGLNCTPSAVFSLQTAVTNEGMTFLNTSAVNDSSCALFMAGTNAAATVSNVSIEVNTVAGANAHMVFRTGAATATGYGTGRIFITNTGIVGIGMGVPLGLTLNAQFQVNSGATGTIAGIFKGFAARTVGILQLQTSAGASLGNVGGTIFDDFVNAGNVDATGETDLYTHTTVANTYAINGDGSIWRVGGLFANTLTAAVRLRVYFAGTLVFDSAAFTLAALADWSVSVMMERVSATVMRFDTTLTTSGASGANYCDYTEVTGLTLTGTNILKITGTSTGAGKADNDIVAKLAKMWNLPAA